MISHPAEKGGFLHHPLAPILTAASAPHVVGLVTAGVELPDGETATCQPEPGPDDVFRHTASVFAVSEMAVRSI